MPTHPQIKNMQKYGHPSFREMQDEVIKENRYIEDIYNEEIRLGDTYYVDEYDQLVHEKSLAQYALDHCELNKKTR